MRKRVTTALSLVVFAAFTDFFTAGFARGTVGARFFRAEGFRGEETRRGPRPAERGKVRKF